MVDELRIVMKRNADGQVESHNTVIYINNEPIGCIQNIKIDIGVNSIPKIEVTFPNFDSKGIDKKATRLFHKAVLAQAAQLSQFSNVSITWQEILGEMDDQEELREIGTNGVIDHIKVHTEL